MNRRDVLKTGLAALLPTWALKASPSPVPLHVFCDPSHTFRWNLTTPFVQQMPDERLFSFATDARACLRVAARDDDRTGEATHRPPCTRFSWDHDALPGWKPWPKESYLLAEGSECLSCRGYGTADGTPGMECDRCYGFGCRACKDTGILIAKADACPACRGKGVGTRPGIQPLGGLHVAAVEDARIRRNLRDIEWTVTNHAAVGGQPLTVIAFRFDGGLGLLMPLDPVRVRERLVRA